MYEIAYLFLLFFLLSCSLFSYFFVLLLLTYPTIVLKNIVESNIPMNELRQMHVFQEVKQLSAMKSAKMNC